MSRLIRLNAGTRKLQFRGMHGMVSLEQRDQLLLKGWHIEGAILTKFPTPR